MKKKTVADSKVAPEKWRGSSHKVGERLTVHQPDPKVYIWINNNFWLIILFRALVGEHVTKCLDPPTRFQTFSAPQLKLFDQIINFDNSIFK